MKDRTATSPIDKRRPYRKKIVRRISFVIVVLLGIVSGRRRRRRRRRLLLSNCLKSVNTAACCTVWYNYVYRYSRYLISLKQLMTAFNTTSVQRIINTRYSEDFDVIKRGQ